MYNTQYSLNLKLYVPQNHSWHFREEKNLISLLGIEPSFLGRSACSLIIVPTALSRLSRESNNVIVYTIIFYIPLKK
jgi:hypothetical protein